LLLRPIRQRNSLVRRAKPRSRQMRWAA